MKKHPWIGWLLITAFGVLVIRSFTDFRTLIATLSTRQWTWLLAAIILHLIYFIPYAQMYQFAFCAVDVVSRLQDMVPLVFASIFANAVVPSGGASTCALFVDDAVRRGQSGASAAVGTVLVLIADLATLVPLLLFGMASLYLRKVLRFYDIIGAAIFVLFVGVLCGALVLAKWKPGWLRRLFGGAQQVVNRVGSWLKRPNLLSAGWAEKNAAEFTDAMKAIDRHPKCLAYTLGLALVVHIISLACLYAIFLAYRQPIAAGPLMAGFGMGIVFWVITVIPQGVGAAEGIMTLVFISLGVPRAKAIAIALVFRGINFYLPLLIGFFFLRRVRAFGIGNNL